MRIVLDTNIIISGLLSETGPSGLLLGLWLWSASAYKGQEVESRLTVQGVLGCKKGPTVTLS